MRLHRVAAQIIFCRWAILKQYSTRAITAPRSRNRADVASKLRADDAYTGLPSIHFRKLSA